jgi:hypothetical protein
MILNLLIHVVGIDNQAYILFFRVKILCLFVYMYTFQMMEFYVARNLYWVPTLNKVSIHSVWDIAKQSD